MLELKNAVIHKAQVDHPFGVIPAKAGHAVKRQRYPDSSRPFWIPDLRCASSGMTGIKNTTGAGHLVFPDKRVKKYPGRFDAFCLRDQLSMPLRAVTPFWK
jgi:hypothetical protein